MANFIDGCKIGIPKAIRRSDFNLLKTCFDGLSEQPAWVAWRLPVWAASECWYMTGELAQAKTSAKKLLFRMGAVPKAHDASLLYKVADLLPESENEPAELRRFRFWHDFADVYDAVDDLLKTLEAGQVFGKLSEYELTAARFLRDRSFDGGYVSDRKKFLSAMYLIGARGLKDVPEFVYEKTTDFKKNFKGKLKTVNLPWWIYDPSTDIGKKVAKTFVQEYGDRFNIDFARFCTMYELLDFAATPKSSISYKDIEKGADFGTNAWLPILLRSTLPYRGMSAHEVKKNWETKVIPLWQKLVERIIE